MLAPARFPMRTLGLLILALLVYVALTQAACLLLPGGRERCFEPRHDADWGIPQRVTQCPGKCPP